ncbi:MAG: class I SAM-dependent methyltransferase [Candidatus Lokiarchaeota archaeon]|nr:class I SAM-dependent methyltransferase [Candidatus Lokiarchaeota archaeon]
MGVKTALYGFKSLMYRSGWLYNAVTRRLYDQDRKFLTIAKLIGNGPQKVLDLPCGTGYLMRFLHPLIEYEGVDLNQRFLKRIRKKELKKRNIKLEKISLIQKDIFDFQDYNGEKLDVIVISDILHHIYPKHKDLINIAKNYTQKIIICEPFAVKPKDINPRDKLFKVIVFFGKFLPISLHRIIDFLFLDNDGINPYHKRSKWCFDFKGIQELYNAMGFNQGYRLLDEYIGIWESTSPPFDQKSTNN